MKNKLMKYYEEEDNEESGGMAPDEYRLFMLEQDRLNPPQESDEILDDLMRSLGRDIFHITPTSEVR